MKILSAVYPSYQWNEEKFFGRKKKSSQWCLYKALQEIFPGVELLEEYQFPTMKFIQSGHLMTFDIYIPALNIVIEYHGYQHYYDHFLYGNVANRKEQDKERRLACTYHNISYLEIPYWWQHDKESVFTIIHQVRPDIVADPHLAIPFHYSK